ncbi:hypothetical protein BLNAU_21713 [Blattamonas nauphoetae]|uniref:Transmembrane protein n=1 Tax=Blattamonas nauphoetae TaxID=2049346 RepID=A0ABQ9WV81_9EUKA|nr:hypothetical protein BLNAU_21713 [Blattamonas nauphoetae]
MLVPCGLDVEVFEWDSEKSEGCINSLQLDTLAITKWTENEIVGQVDLKTSLSTLKSSLEWRARLVFGDNGTTSNSILFASASSTGKGNMSQGGTSSKILWIIPVVVCVILALILLIGLIILAKRQSMKKKNNQSLLANENSTMEMDEVIVKEEEDVPDSTLNRMMNREGSIVTQSRQPILCKADTENQTCSDDPFHPPSEMVVRDIRNRCSVTPFNVHPFDKSCVVRTVCFVVCMVENERKGISWKRVASSVANGLVQLHLRNPTHHALRTQSTPNRPSHPNSSTCHQPPSSTSATPPIHPQKSGLNEGERKQPVRKDEEQQKTSMTPGVSKTTPLATSSLPAFLQSQREAITLSLSDSLNELAQTDQSAAALSHKIVQ